MSRFGMALLGGAAVIVLTLFVYQPAVNGDFVWDDESYVTENKTLRTAAGLKDIWLSPGATPQYYPLVFTSFWLEFRLWQLRPLGYHLTNVALHIGNVLLLWSLLHALAVPGAWLAAAAWGLHPMNVESVAWITERKNVLSGFFYLAALLLFVRGRRDPDAGDDGNRLTPGTPARLLLACVCFLCALLSKTVTATLPLALALLWWWKGVAPSGRRIRILLALFAVGAAFGGLTLWMEKFHVGAQGVDFTLTPPQRLVVAGRALWFYLGKLLWPARLVFIYPRWDVQGASWLQYLYPAAAAGTVAALWGLRGRLGKGPLTAVLYFIATLAPALGFVDFFPMRYSFVADHFAYLASIGPLVLFASLLDRGFDAALARARHGLAPPRERTKAWLRAAAASAIVLPLAALTWRQGGIYRDLETLWRDTLAKNPSAWMAHLNLGGLLFKRGDIENATRHFQEVLALRPESFEAHLSLGAALAARGETGLAASHYRRSIALNPRLPMPYNNLGILMTREGRLGEARNFFTKAITLDPEFPDGYYNLALIAVNEGRTGEAIALLSRASQLSPYDEAIRELLAKLR